jgi:outer membrane protein, heavy metal efflux system
MSLRAVCMILAVTLLWDARMSMAQSPGYPDSLPPELNARAALEDSPQVRAAREQIGIAEARRGQLDAGPYEWTVGATGQQRKDAIGATYSEQSYELSRTLRWFGKAGLDRELGERTVVAGEHAFADAWHEAARAMLTGWFAWLQALESERLLASNVELLGRQLGAVQARVRTGDAPRLEESLAQAELDRVLAARIEAGLQVEESALALRHAFPELTLTPPGAPGAPELPTGPDDAWTARILGHNHEIELAEAVHDQARIAAQRADRDRIADPAVALRFSNNFDGNDRVVGVAVSLPIGGARRGAAYSQALGEANVAGQRAREVRLKVEAEAARAVSAMRADYAKWQRLRDVAERSAANAEAIARGYGLGEFTISEMLTARRSALDSTVAETTARLGASASIARLRLDAHEIWALEAHRDEQGP